jgi:undecaprenyl diphosphate synthase
MRLAERYLDEELPEVMANDIQVRAIGRLDRLPPRVRKQVEHAVEKTRDNGKLKLVFALSYGGRAEIVDAARRLARDASRAGSIPTRSTRRCSPPISTIPSCPIPTC